jgi:hypothetical protein
LDFRCGATRMSLAPPPIIDAAAETPMTAALASALAEP